MIRNLYTLILFAILSLSAMAQPQFDFELQSSTIAEGAPGDILILLGDFVNDSGSPIDVLINREQNNIPENWSTSLCITECYPPGVNIIVETVDPGEDVSFSFYFFTSFDTEGSGAARVSLTNMADTTNKFVFDFAGSTEFLTTSVSEHSSDEISFNLSPNPTSDNLQMFFSGSSSSPSGSGSIQIISLTGKVVLSREIGSSREQINVEFLPRGHYILRFREKNGKQYTSRFVKS